MPSLPFVVPDCSHRGRLCMAAMAAVENNPVAEQEQHSGSVAQHTDWVCGHMLDCQTDGIPLGQRRPEGGIYLALLCV